MFKLNRCYGGLASLEAKALAEVNQLVPGDTPSSLLAALHNEHAGIVNIKDENQLHYSTLLQVALQAKRQVPTRVIVEWCKHILNIYFQCSNLIKHSKLFKQLAPCKFVFIHQLLPLLYRLCNNGCYSVCVSLLGDW